MEFWYSFFSSLMDNLLTPVLAVLGGALVYILKHWLDKVSKSIIAKNELEELEKTNSIRQDLLKTISEQVDAAVGANMQLADKMKESGHTLSDEQISELNNNAKELVMNALPPSLSEKDGVLLEMIGGPERLDKIIDTFMENSVYQWKLKKTQTKPKTISRKKTTEKG